MMTSMREKQPQSAQRTQSLFLVCGFGFSLPRSLRSLRLLSLFCVLLAADALVAVLRSQLLEQPHGRGERRDALHRAVRHVRRRLPAARDSGDVGAVRDEILDHL